MEELKIITEELKTIMEVLAGLDPDVRIAFLMWCIKKICTYLVFPLTSFVIGKAVYKIVIETQKKYKYFEQDKSQYNSAKRN